MGRVSRFKKVKKDPFRPKVRPVEVAPDFSKEENLKIPIKLRLINNSIKRFEDHAARVKEHRQRKKAEAEGKVPPAATASSAAEPASQPKGTSGGLIKLPEQLPGESYEQFSRRLANATRQALRTQKLKPKKASADRRKQYMKEKAKKKKRQSTDGSDGEDADGAESGGRKALDFDDLQDKIGFDEHVDRPPTLTARPKQRKVPGALPIGKPASTVGGKSFLFLKKLRGEEVPEPEEAEPEAGPKVKKKKAKEVSVDDQLAAEERESRRSEVVQRYKAFKKQQRSDRKGSGGEAFYL